MRFLESCNAGLQAETTQETSRVGKKSLYIPDEFAQENRY